jgi:hypothetical protein
VLQRCEDERGAIIVQVAVAGVVMLGLGAFVIDYGVLWVSRQQAQNAADAGATAGAVARAYDDTDATPSPGGIVEQSVTSLVAANPVWFEAGTNTVSYDCPPDVGAVVIPCVRVDVFRDSAHGNPLPTFFGPVLGIMSQDIRATATAVVAPGNTTTCLKPWAIPDRWIEQRPIMKGWSPGDVFSRYVESGPGAGTLLSPADSYVAPAAGGMTPAADVGLQLSVTFADPAGTDPISTGFLLPLALPGGSYEGNMAGCNGRLHMIGEVLPTEFSTGATASGFSDLIAADASASWDGATNSVRDSCAPGDCGAISPRLVAMALYNVDEYQLGRATGWPSCGGPCVRVTNIIGFFIESATGSGAVGYVTKYPGMFTEAAPVLPDSSFLPAIALIR